MFLPQAPAMCPICAVCPCCTLPEYITKATEESTYVYVRENSVEFNMPGLSSEKGACCGNSICGYRVADNVQVVYYDAMVMDQITDKTRCCNDCRTMCKPLQLNPFIYHCCSFGDVVVSHTPHQQNQCKQNLPDHSQAPIHISSLDTQRISNPHPLLHSLLLLCLRKGTPTLFHSMHFSLYSIVMPALSHL